MTGKVAFVIVVLVSILLSGCRKEYTLQWDCAPPSAPEPEPPNRPGVNGFRLRRLVRQDVYFEVIKDAGIMEIPFDQLIGKFYGSEAIVEIRIVIRGRKGIVEDVRLILGRRADLEMLERIFWTWSFTPYKEGTIIYWFNMEASGSNVVIDTSGLRLVGRYRNWNIRDRNLCPGVPRDRITYARIRRR